MATAVNLSIAAIVLHLVNTFLSRLFSEYYCTKRTRRSKKALKLQFQQVQKKITDAILY